MKRFPAFNRLWFFGVLALAPVFPASGGVVISEFMASNASGLNDEDDDQSDWIEILNDSAGTVNLDGWGLSDDSDDPFKWVFPARSISPGEAMIVFASGKDRKPAVGTLHSNFKLAAGGEYLGLHQPGGALANEYSPQYPVQVSDVSYGLPLDTHVGLIGQAAACEVGVPVSQIDYDTEFLDWKTSLGSFTGSSWQAGAHTGVGYDANGAYGSLLGQGGDILSRLRYHQRSVCLRVPFTVEDPANVASLLFRMKWDDGFAAYINGTPIAQSAAPASPLWDSLATSNRSEALNNSWTEWTISAGDVPLQAGLNILSLHGFNVTTGSSDFLLLPLLDGTLLSGTGDIAPTWFLAPTPGTANGSGGSIGPRLTEATSSIPRPTGSGSSPMQVVTVRVTETVFPVDSVKCFYRTMFAAESQQVMNDNGVAPDQFAGDGVFSAWLPTTGPGAGEMLRWRFEALDDQGDVSRAPAFLDPSDSDEYFGSVALNPDTASSSLTVLHWFIDDAAAANTRGGTRASFFYLTEFYDNVLVNLHGQTTSGFPKKSYDVDFNHGNRFLWKVSEGRVKDINLLTNYSDRTKARNTLSHEMGMKTGTVYHFCDPVRIERNGAFHGVWDMMEDADDRMLERNGLDPDGAFYKMYNKLTSSTSGVEKKTRKEEGNSDLAALIAGLNPSLPLSDRRRWAYDNVNLPATINYLVTRQFNSDRDHGHKNYFVYRDTENTGEWRPIIWDVDLSHGHNYTGTRGYFDDELIYYNPLNAGSLDNRLYNLVYESPELRVMFLRRMRTLMDTLLKAPGTGGGQMDTRMREIAALIDPDPADPSAWTDGDRDFTKWGTWGRGNRCREDVEEVIAGYLEPRRSFLFDQNPSTRPTLEGDPIPDSGQSNDFGIVGIGNVDYLPSSGDQSDEYLILRNLTGAAVDVSGWTLSGAIDHEIEGGTVIPSGDGSGASEYQGLLHVVKDAASFRATGGNQMRLIQGNYKGQFSARGETVELRDPEGTLIATHTYAGTPTALQQSLRLSEIHYNPAAPSAGELMAMPGVQGNDFEFVELMNIGPGAINLTGARFTNGIDFTFPSLSLAAGGRLVVAANPEALALRYGVLPVPILGPYLGRLSGGGERIELSDAVGEVIVDFTFKDGWYPATDGSGRSLVARDPVSTSPDGYGEAEVWAISGDLNGSPGVEGTGFAQAYYGWDNFHFSAGERANPLIGGPKGDPDGDGISNFLEYALGGNPNAHDPLETGFEWVGAHPGIRFRRPTNAIDLEFTLLKSASLLAWMPVSGFESPVTASDDGYEELVLGDPVAGDSTAGYLRLRVNWH